MSPQIQNVNPSFNIQAPKIYTNPAQLFIEAGPMGISFVILNTGDCFQAVVMYTFPNKLTEAEVNEELEDILKGEPLMKKQYKKIHIIWTYPESILVPPDLFDRDNNAAMLNLVFGDVVKGNVQHEFLYKHNLHNTYRVPGSAAKIFEELLPSATQSHQYSLLVDQLRKGGNELFVLFYTGSLTLMLCKDDKLQVIRNFTYNTPEDIIYHLLNVCRSFDVEPEAAKLRLSGMVDKRSNLYAAVHKYFLQIEFENLPANFTVAEELKSQPPHFFSHLFYQALCV